MTPPSRADFLIEFPEFDKAPVTLVDKVLYRAGIQTRQATYGQAEAAVRACMLKAAILLLRSPYAQRMRLDSMEQVSAYEVELYEMQRSGTMGLRCF